MKKEQFEELMDRIECGHFSTIFFNLFLFLIAIGIFISTLLTYFPVKNPLVLSGLRGQIEIFSFILAIIIIFYASYPLWKYKFYPFIKNFYKKNTRR